MSGITKAFLFGLLGAPAVLLLIAAGVPYLAAVILVVGICVIAGYRFGWQDRPRG